MNTMNATANAYGVFEVNPLTKAQAARQQMATRSVYWDTPGLRITRLRLLSDPGLPFWDVSYCSGELRGEPVAVELPFSQLARSTRAYGAYMKAPSIAAQIIAHAKRDGVYAKGTGIFDAISTLV